MGRVMDAMRDRSWNERFGLAFGSVYVLVGLAGFLVTAGVGFAASSGRDLIIFEVNPLHNLVHLAVGGLLVTGAALGAARSRAVNLLVGSVYALVAVGGLFLVGRSFDILALNQPDNALHFATAALALAIGLRADRTHSDRTGADRTRADRTEAPSVQPARLARTSKRRQPAAGDTVQTGGTYRCSCGDFAVFVRSGGVLPACTVGDGHNYTLTKPARAAAS